MAIYKTLTAMAMVAGTVLASSPAAAVVTTFAQYTASGRGGNIYWANNGSGGTVGQNATTGTGGSFYTISGATGTTAGSHDVVFSFLQPNLASVVDVIAKFTLNASVTNSPATLADGALLQAGITGSFSFISTAPITINSVTYETGANLLSGTFTRGVISGAKLANAGEFSPASIPTTSVTFTSDFMTFSAPSSNDFSLSLSAITGALQAIPTLGGVDPALRTFRASSTGLFSSNLEMSETPEPATWGLMIVGFGLVGMQTRRRRALAKA